MNEHPNPAGRVNAGALNDFADGVEKRVTGGGNCHVASLLPDHSPGEPDPPTTWKDEEALNEWKRDLPDRDTVVVLRVVYADPEPFEQEVRSSPT